MKLRLLSLSAVVAATLAACGLDSDDALLLEDPQGLAGAQLGIASVRASADDGNVPANVLDSSLATRWSCYGTGCWITADLGATRSVTGAAVAWYVGDRRVNTFTLSVSQDGTTWTQAYSGRSSGTTLQQEAYAITPVNARYVRLTVNGNTMNLWASVTELRVWGSEVSTQPPPPPPPPPPATGTDAFGTKALYPSASGGRAWSAKWSSNPRVLRAGQVDPYDPEFAMRGDDNNLEIKGDGTAKSYGNIIRMYVGDRSRQKLWQNVEVTVYGKRVAERSGAGSTSGFEFQARTDDGHTSGTRLNAAGYPIQCDGKSYGFAFRNDGRGLMEKELKHPETTSQRSKNVWSGAAFPRDQWVGMKFVIYNTPSGVKQELWRDLTDGANGGTWVKVNESLDTGGWSISATSAASCGIPADYRITQAQPLLILRNDLDAERWYKKFTVREIAPQ